MNPNPWNNNFPPFLVWLYGWLTQRGNNHIVIPADAWRQVDDVIRSMPAPRSRIEKFTGWLLRIRLERTKRQWIRLDTQGCSAIGYISLRHDVD